MDFDVTDKKGNRLSREDFNSPPRTCIVCNKKPAFICIGERNHSLKETLNSIDLLISTNKIVTRNA